MTVDEVFKRMGLDEIGLNEMAYDRGWIIDKCEELGMMFVKHFDKIWHDVDTESQKHHLEEMQAWYDKVERLKFKHNNKLINTKQLFDWFFMPNAVVATDLFDDEKEACFYLDFVNNILDEDMDTITSFISSKVKRW